MSNNITVADKLHLEYDSISRIKDGLYKYRLFYYNLDEKISINTDYIIDINKNLYAEYYMEEYSFKKDLDKDKVLKSISQKNKNEIKFLTIRDTYHYHVYKEIKRKFGIISSKIEAPEIYLGLHSLTMYLYTLETKYYNDAIYYYFKAMKEENYKDISIFAIHFLSIISINNICNSGYGIILLASEVYKNYALKFFDNYKRYKNNNDIKVELIQDYYCKIANETFSIMQNKIFEIFK